MRSGRARRALAAALLVAAAASAFSTGRSGRREALLRPEAIRPDAVQADFAALWRFVDENYAYLDSSRTNWAAVPDLYHADLSRVKTRAEWIGVYERVLDELHDAHAQLTVNTPDSPRIVPSGADLWAAWRRGRAVVEEVRAGSDAERAGIPPGAEVLALDEVPIDRCVASRIGRAARSVDDEVRSWALRAVLAGRHGRERRIRFRAGDAVTAVVLPARDPVAFRAPGARLSSRTLPGDVAWIRLNDSLGDPRLVADFDAALASCAETTGLVLDLRDTPSGGNTAVARGILGRFLAVEKPYQKHVLAAEERQTGVRRSWLELVTPRGPFRYAHRVAVLVDHWTGSMGEGLAIGFDATAAGTVVGTPMAGLRGATEHFDLPRSRFGVNVPTEKLYHVDGTPREEFQPPVRVTEDDLARARGNDDPWIRRALEILRRP